MAQSRPVLQANIYGEIYFVPPPSVLKLVVTFSLYKKQHRIDAQKYMTHNKLHNDFK